VVASTRLCMVHLVVVEWCHKGEGLLRRMAEEAVAMVVHSMVVVVANMVDDNDTYIHSCFMCMWGPAQSTYAL
jgi:hypothetical protein